MKRLLLVLVLLMTAGSLFAAELKITGDAHVRGNYESVKPDGGDATSVQYFDYDFNLNAALVANENATVFLRLTYDRNIDESGKVSDGNGTAVSDFTDEEQYGVLNVERAYLNYKFHPALQLNTGLMGGGQWASAFGNNEINVMRVQAIGALSKDMIFIATYQKNNENGIDFGDKEGHEDTVYYLSSVLTFGNIKVLPLFTYQVNGKALRDASFDATLTQYAFTLGVNGDFGMIGLESEFFAAMVDTDDVLDNFNSKDPKVYGAYVNVFAKLNAAKVGIAAAYASTDKKTGGSYTYGGDFDFTMIVDDLYWGAVDGLPGMTSFKLYAEAPVMEKLTLDAAFAYGFATDKKVPKYAVDLDGQVAQGLQNAGMNFMSGGAVQYVTNPTTGFIGKDLSYWEVNLGATYAFDANASYNISFGYAKAEADGAEDTLMAVTHKFSVKF